jgi:hypothetical protein
VVIWLRHKAALLSEKVGIIGLRFLKFVQSIPVGPPMNIQKQGIFLKG